MIPCAWSWGPHGIDVVIIEPSGTDSEWGTIAGEGLLAASGGGPYSEQAHVVAAALASTSGTGHVLSTPPARVVAKTIVRAATAKRPPRTRYPVGRGSLERPGIAKGSSGPRLRRCLLEFLQKARRLDPVFDVVLRRIHSGFGFRPCIAVSPCGRNACDDGFRWRVLDHHALAPIALPAPMVMGPRTFAPAPMVTPSPMVGGCRLTLASERPPSVTP